MKKILLSLVLVLVISSVAAAAPKLSGFPVGMSQKEAVAKGLIMKDDQGGILNVEFGGKEWPTAMVFENEKLVYLILKGVGDEYVSAADEGLWQLGWLVIYSMTDKNLVFDAIKLSSSGKDETAIGEEYETFLATMKSMNFKNSVSMYISDRVWKTFKSLSGENPVEVYPDATLCNVTSSEKDVTLVFTTFGYMDKMKKQSAPDNKANTETKNEQKQNKAPGQEAKNEQKAPAKTPAKTPARRK